jgi:hypothetical protein
MKPKHLLILIPLLFAFYLFATPGLIPITLGEEPPAAEQPADKPEAKPADKAADTAEAKPAEKAEEKADEKKEDDAASGIWNPSLWEVVGSIIVIIWGLIVAKFKLKEGKKKTITQAFEAAVQDTYTEFVRGLKTGREDGKLTKEEVKKAQGMAWEKAKEFLKTKGIDLGKEVATEYGPVIVTKIVQLFKKDKKD